MNSTIANILIGLLIIGGSVAFGVLTKKMFISISIIICYLLYLLFKYAYVSTDGKTDYPLPTSYYMKKVGGQCPDYWKVVGQDKDTVTCQNQFDIRVNYGKSSDGKNENCQDCKEKFPLDWKTKCTQCRNPAFSCYNSDAKSKSKTFKLIKKWPLKKDNPGKKERCKWWANCGVTKTQNASWIGLDC